MRRALGKRAVLAIGGAFALLSVLASPAAADLGRPLDTYFDGPPGKDGKPSWTAVPRDEWTQVPPVSETSQDKWGRTTSAFECFDFGPYPNVTQAAYGVTNIVLCGDVNFALPAPAGESPPAGQTWVCFDGPDAIKYTVPFTEPRCNWGVAGGSFQVQLTDAQLSRGLELSKRVDTEAATRPDQGATIEGESAPEATDDRLSPDEGLPDWAKALIGTGGVAALTAGGFQVTRKRKWTKEKGERPVFEEQLDVTKEVKGSVLDDHVTGKAGAGLYTERKSNVSLGKDGLTSRLDAKAQLGGKVELEEHLASEKDAADLYSKQEVFLGSEMETKNEANITREGVDIGSHSGTFTGIRAKGEVTGRLGGFELTDEAQAQAGAGASYTVGVTATPHKIAGAFGGSASFGVGGGNTVKFSVDLDRVGSDVDSTLQRFASPPAPRGTYQLTTTGSGW